MAGAQRGGVSKEWGGRERSNLRAEMGRDPGRDSGRVLSQGARGLVVEAETGSLGRRGGDVLQCGVHGGLGCGGDRGPELCHVCVPSASPLRAEMASSFPSASCRIPFCSIFFLRHWKLKKHIFAY